jgi:hypothetical protein
VPLAGTTVAAVTLAPDVGRPIASAGTVAVDICWHVIGAAAVSTGGLEPPPPQAASAMHSNAGGTSRPAMVIELMDVSCLVVGAEPAVFGAARNGSMCCADIRGARAM